MSSPRMMFTATVALALVASASVASAGNLLFNTIDSFESQTPGSQPDEFHDGDTDWLGDVTVQSSGTDGVTTGAAGGNQFARILPGPDGSFSANTRQGPYAHTGASQAYPAAAGDRYSFLVDIYTKAADTASGKFTWINGVNDSDTIGNGDTVASGDIVMTEAGYNFTPGDATWDVIARGTSGTAFSLAADTWYTFEVVFDKSGPLVQAIHNIYLQGSDTALYSVTSTPDDDRFSGSQGALSADMGGPRYSWFTVWDNETVDALYIDNIGTSVPETAPVPEPASLALLSLGAGGLVMMRRRRRASLETCDE